MKKIFAAAALLAAVMIMAGCQGGKNEETAAFTAKPTQSTTTVATVEEVEQIPAADPTEMKSLFKAPKEAVEIDMTLDDPSTPEMKFLFDDKKRVVGIYYTIKEHPIMVNYGYDDSTSSVKIVTFAESVIVDQKKIDLPAFDETAGFAEKDGYYFKGYKFE